MRNIFQSTPAAHPNKSSHDLSHSYVTTHAFGELVPNLTLDMLPGDHVNLSAENLTRFMPMLTPPMYGYDVTQHYWFVPYRILADFARDFFIGKKDPITGLVPAAPIFEINPDGSNYTRLMNYMRIPTPSLAGTSQNANSEEINAWAFAAYQCVYHQRYRDQNLVPEFNYKLVQGDNGSNAELFKLRNRAYGHDYFNSCAPTPQYGDAVKLPSTGYGDVPVKLHPASDFAPTGSIAVSSAGGGTSATLPGEDADWQDPANQSSMFADTSTLTPDTPNVNDFRLMFSLQRIKEKLMTFGRRYKEYVRAFFGFEIPDYRIDDPEFVYGTSTPVVTSEVLSTNGTASQYSDTLGAFAGHGVSVTPGSRGSYTAKEHGVLIGIQCCRPKTAYFQGIPKMFLKKQTEDYFLPELAHIGAQPVEVREVYAYVDEGDQIFGYQDPFQEHRFIPNAITGEMQKSLLNWHSARKYLTTPALGQGFIEVDPQGASEKRIFAYIGDNNSYLVSNTVHRIQLISTVPKYGDPRFI